MADNTIEYMIRLVDEASAPLKQFMATAKRAETDVQSAKYKNMGLSKDEIDTLKQAKSLKREESVAKYQAMGLSKREAAELAKTDGAKVKSSKQLAKLWNRNTEIGSGVTAMANKMGIALGMGVGAAVAMLAYGFASAGVAAYDMTSKMERNLTVTMRSSEAAKHMTAELAKWSANSGVARDDMAQWAFQLTEIGVKGDNLKKTLAGMADLQAMGFKPEGLMEMHKKIRQMQIDAPWKKTVSGGEAIAMFQAMGMDPSRLEKVFGMSLQKLKQSSVQIDDVVKASRLAIMDATGKDLGGFAASDPSVAASWKKLGAVWENLFAKSDFRPLNNAIGELMRMFERQDIQAGFATAMTVVSYTMAGAVDAMGGLVWLCTIGIPRGATWTVSALGRLGNAFVGLLDPLGALRGASWFIMTSFEAGFGSALLRTGQSLAEFGGTLMGWGMGLGAAILGFFGTVFAAAGSIGRAIVDGIMSGLRTAWGGLVKEITSLTDTLPASVRSVLGIKSPSTVFAGIGGYMAEGMGVGFQAKLPDVTDSIRGMIPQTSTTSNTRSVSQSNSFTMNSSGGSPEDSFEAFRRMFIRITQDALVEMGAAS